MALSEILSVFARETGAGEFVAGGDGVYHLEIDEIPVSLREDAETGGLVTQGEVAYVPEEARGRLCRILMESMYLWAGTDGASFVVEPVSDRLLLQRTDPLKSLDVEGFKAMLAEAETAVNACGGDETEARKLKVLEDLLVALVRAFDLAKEGGLPRRDDHGD